MKLKPTISVSKPDYPTEYLFIQNPNLFTKYTPIRWQTNKLVFSALSAFVFLGTNKIYAEKPQIVSAVMSKEQNPTNNQSEQKSNKIKVAPIFVHGEGSGGVGCVVISPPVFISESEALQIISDELKKQKIVIDTADCPVIDFTTIAIADDCYESGSYNNKANVSLKMSAVDKEHTILIKYISYKDYIKYQSDSCNMWSSAQSIRTKKAAYLFRDAVDKKDGKYNIAIFYDPMSESGIDFYSEINLYEQNYNEPSKKMLIAQVEDFIQWLINEGIINK